MSSTLALVGKELKAVFVSPLAWVLIAIVNIIMAYIFLSHIELYIKYQGQLAALEHAPDLSDVFISDLYSSAFALLMLITPLLTMRLLSEELRARTIEILFAAPISNAAIIVSKFVAVTLFAVILILPVFVMPLSLTIAGELDIGVYLSALMGVILATMAVVAIGLYISACTAYPAMAATISIAIILLLSILNTVAEQGQEGELTLAYFSFSSHLAPLLKGMVSGSDIAFFLVVIVLFNVLAILRLRRWRD